MKGIRKISVPTDWILLFGAVCLLPVLLEYVVPRFLTGYSTVYIAKPLGWIIIAIFVMRLPRLNSAGKQRLLPTLIGIACGIAFSQIYLMLLAGFLDGFGRSPYSFTLSGVLINLLYVVSMLAGMELSRAWLINRLLRKPGFLVPLLMAVLYTLISIPVSKFPSWGSTLEAWTQFLGSTLLPVSMEQLLASFLAMWGGTLPALAYRGILEGFHWFSPVLPDLSWLMKALAGTVIPLVGLAILQEYCANQCARRRSARLQEKGYVSTAIFGAVLVGIIWFSMGVFPVRPMVIYSGSMRPVFDAGDIVFVVKNDTALLREGDIISYRVAESPVSVIHRITEIKGDKTIITKGDDNEQADDPIVPEQVRGKVVLVVPDVGWASIYVKDIFM
ncbi:MAG: signal peptidase I [Syntrophaceticus sp.]|nr:signal peptidase I [Syntrophaceticus sp.]MDD3315597.1 signal peptidase I [Syntrophaceticus sp.]MDD4359793.1 signal peptidase I [Syntrophaceticus sp.]MDD4782431.1 signal peptidase I [Syntrophaceticus sp.]